VEYDVIIVGCGPAGIFSALELAERTDLKILMLDKGYGIDKRRHLAGSFQGVAEPDRSFWSSGWGGAGAFSDGKLTLSQSGGGWLAEYCGQERLGRLLEYVDSVYLRYGASRQLYGGEPDRIASIAHRAALAGLKFVPQKVRHMGTEKCAEILFRMYEHIKDRVEVRTETEVKHLLVQDNQIAGVETTTDETIHGKYVIVAPGRSGAEWLRSQAEAFGLEILNNPVDIGIRVEVQAALLEELTQTLYEPKFIYYSKAFDDPVRTFCVVPHGEVITESSNGVLTVNGQSYAERKTQNSNFAILVTTSFTEPFKEPISYGKYLARLANLLSGGVIVQRLGDLNAGRRSTSKRIQRSLTIPTLASATPGDLSFVLPYRYLTDLREMLQALERLAPGLNSKDTLLYGVEVKFYSSRLALSKELETAILNLFTIGDGAGVSRGLVQSSASGIIVAEAIAEREVKRSVH
jgi:hypothetical protein